MPFLNISKMWYHAASSSEGLTELRIVFSLHTHTLWVVACRQRVLVPRCYKGISLLSQRMIYLNNLYLGSSCGFASTTNISSPTIVHFQARGMSCLVSNGKLALHHVCLRHINTRSLCQQMMVSDVVSFILWSTDNEAVAAVCTDGSRLLLSQLSIIH